MTTAAEKKTYRYEVRFPEKSTWGIFFLTSDGIFMAVTDYENFAHRWPVAGFPKTMTDFREFFLQFDNDYILGKLTNEKVVDEDKTKATVKKLIEETIKDIESKGSGRTVDRMRIEDLQEELENIDELDVSDERSFEEWASNTKCDPHDAFGCISMCRAHAWEQMAKLFFPELRKLIRAELLKEKQKVCQVEDTTGKKCDNYEGCTLGSCQRT